MTINRVEELLAQYGLVLESFNALAVADQIAGVPSNLPARSGVIVGRQG